MTIPHNKPHTQMVKFGLKISKEETRIISNILKKFSHVEIGKAINEASTSRQNISWNEQMYARRNFLRKTHNYVSTLYNSPISCYYCGQTGHMKFEWFKRQKDLKIKRREELKRIERE